MKKLEMLISSCQLRQAIETWICRYSDHWSFTPMNLRTNGTLDRWNFGHNKFTVQWTINYKNNFSFRFMNRRTYWTFWPRATNSWTVWHNELSDQQLPIHGPSGILNFLTDRASDKWTVGHNEFSDQELQIHGPSGIMNFLTNSFRSMNRWA